MKCDYLRKIVLISVILAGTAPSASAGETTFFTLSSEGEHEGRRLSTAAGARVPPYWSAARRQLCSGQKTCFYVYAAGEYSGPYDKVLDVRVSPSGKKYAVVYQKADDNTFYFTYQGKEFVVDTSEDTLVTFAQKNCNENYLWMRGASYGPFGDHVFIDSSSDGAYVMLREGELESSTNFRFHSNPNYVKYGSAYMVDIKPHILAGGKTFPGRILYGQNGTSGEAVVYWDGAQAVSVQY